MHEGSRSPSGEASRRGGEGPRRQDRSPQREHRSARSLGIRGHMLRFELREREKERLQVANSSNSAQLRGGIYSQRKRGMIVIRAKSQAFILHRKRVSGLIPVGGKSRWKQNHVPTSVKRGPSNPQKQQKCHRRKNDSLGQRTRSFYNANNAIRRRRLLKNDEGILGSGPTPTKHELSYNKT